MRLSLIAVILLLAGSAQAATLTVCPSGCEYSSIQAAINAANSGDTIEIQSGTYFENVVVDKKLKLQGNKTGNEAPIIDANNKGNATTINADGVELAGISFRKSAFADIVVNSYGNYLSLYTPAPAKGSGSNYPMYPMNLTGPQTPAGYNEGSGGYGTVLRHLRTGNAIEPADSYNRKFEKIYDVSGKKYYGDLITVPFKGTKNEIKIFFAADAVRTSWKSEKIARNLSDKGSELLKLGKYDEAIQAFNEAIKVNPELAYIWYYKGTALYKQKNYSEAIQAYDEAIELNPDYVDAWYYKGCALYYLSKYDEAIQAFDKIIEDHRAYRAWKGSAWNKKGDTLKALNHTIEADAAFAKAKELGYSG